MTWPLSSPAPTTDINFALREKKSIKFAEAKNSMFKHISKYYWWCQAGGWLFWMVLNIILAKYYQRTMDTAYFLNQIGMVICGIGLTHLMRLVILKLDWLDFSLDKLLIRIPVLVALCALLLTFCRGYLIITFQSGNEEEHLFSLWRLIGSSLLITTWTLIYFVGHYFQKEQQFQLDKLQLESVVKDLELRTIKSQLNPHFLFNSLNSIRALVDENPERARTAITELSNILRGSMQVEKLEFVSLQQELSIIKDYLALEHIRFEERLKVNYQIEEDTLDFPIPPMMLQTLVENAIKHGISHSIEGGQVTIISRISDLHHEIIIQNTGQLKSLPKEHHGFGLQSTRQRLNLLYKNKALFAIHNLNDHIVETIVKIPL